MDHEQIWPLVRPRLCQFFSRTMDVKLIVETVGVTQSTVGEWLADSRPAKGETLIGLWHFLAAAGCESPELDELHPYNRYVGELLAFSVVSMAEVLDILNIKNPQTALGALRGRPPMHPSLNLEDLRAMYGDALNQAKAKLQKQLPRVADPPLQEHALPPALAPLANEPSLPVPVAQAIGSGDNGVLLTASVLGQALPLVRHMVSSGCTPADRNLLRELMGEGGVFELSNHLNALCSERARKQTR